MTRHLPPLPPGARIGIFGGGQLGRMLSQAGAKLGFDIHIYADEHDTPAARVSARLTTAPYDDQGALAAFAGSVDVITTEFENIPTAALEYVAAAGTPVHPSPKAVAVAQDRLSEKAFVQSLGIPTARFQAVYTEEELAGAVEALGGPCILKTRRLGYDGKGQVRIPSAEAVAVKEAWEAIGAQPAILEGQVAFTHEASVILARGADGALAAFEVCENHHQDGILRVTRVPAQTAPEAAAAAFAAARAIAEGLDYVGVLAVEFFITPDGRALVNELAPRVHNSGHWTVEGCHTNQFEQHIRAIAGWPLGTADRRPGSVEMTNLIGSDLDAWAALASDPSVRLTLYGKEEARQGRKMGHFVRVMDS
jgi:5-(carboxyamino)imidazole ribonucleotide synthase